MRLRGSHTFGSAKADGIQSIVDGLSRNQFTTEEERVRTQHRKALRGALEASILGQLGPSCLEFHHRDLEDGTEGSIISKTTSVGSIIKAVSDMTERRCPLFNK